MSFKDRLNVGSLSFGFACLVGVILFAQAIMGPPAPPPAVPETMQEGEPCIGQAIEVDYAYSRAQLDPWECQVQCEDNVRRYVKYTNGLATQCQTPPGCNDWGEDNGITCVPPDLNS